MVKKYLLAVATLMLLISSVFGATIVTTYSNGYCEEEEVTTVDTKFADVEPSVVEMPKPLIVYTQKSSSHTGKTQTCEYRGECNCVVCESVDTFSFSGMVKNFFGLSNSRFSSNYQSTACSVAGSPEEERSLC